MTFKFGPKTNVLARTERVRVEISTEMRSDSANEWHSRSVQSAPWRSCVVKFQGLVLQWWIVTRKTAILRYGMAKESAISTNVRAIGFIKSPSISEPGWLFSSAASTGTAVRHGPRATCMVLWRGILASTIIPWTQHTPSIWGNEGS